jgi:hypothetical protein
LIRTAGARPSCDPGTIEARCHRVRHIVSLCAARSFVIPQRTKALTRHALLVAAVLAIWFFAIQGQAFAQVAIYSSVQRNDAPPILKIPAPSLAYGLTIDAANPRVTWYHTLPRHTLIREGQLILHIASNQVPNHRSAMRVNINGTPRAIFRRSTAAELSQDTLTVALEQADFSKESIAVEIMFETRDQVDQRGCRDIDHISYMRILPSSVLAVTPALADVNGIGAYLERLPKQVDLTIPAQASIDAIHAAWHVSAMLRAMGHATRIQPDPAPGHIVIADSAQWPRTATSEKSMDVDMQLLEKSGQKILFIAQTLATRHTALDFTPLMHLTQFSTRSRAQKTGDHESVPLSDVLSSPLYQEYSGSAQWEGYLSSRHMPAGYLPSGLSLRIVSAVLNESRRSRLHVFVNDELIQSVGLQRDGDRDSIEIKFPRALQRDRVRIRLRIDDEHATHCISAVSSPIQISPESAVTLKKTDFPTVRSPNFAMLSRRFAAPFAIYYDSASLQNAVATIGILSRLTEQFDAEPDRAMFIAVDSVKAPGKGSDFIWLSAMPPDGFDSSLRPVGKAMHVKERSGTYVLPMEELRGLSVAALVYQNSQLGLWMRPGAPGSTLNVPETLAVDAGDVAFFDQRAVLLATNNFASQPASEKVLEAAYVKPLMDKRNWLYAALWVGAVLLIVAGWRIVQSRGSK